MFEKISSIQSRCRKEQGRTNVTILNFRSWEDHFVHIRKLHSGRENIAVRKMWREKVTDGNATASISTSDVAQRTVSQGLAVKMSLRLMKST